MEALDNFLLGRIYTPLSRVAGRWWGSTACSLSRACIAPMLVFGGLRVVTNPEANPAYLAFLLPLAAVFWWHAAAANQTPNMFNTEPPGWRLIWIIFVIIALFGFTPQLWKIAWVLEEIACLSIIYFRSVPAPPPKERREPKANSSLGATA